MILLSGILIVITYNYLSCPVYDFKPGEAFSGKEFYNPYAELDSNNWRKANFQVQSKAWSGITSGSKNSNELIHEVYSKLGYDVIATSDYQKINKYQNELPSYIPVYEHGYGIFKNHQVLIGAKKVLWTDFPFFQTLSNKQHVLNKLRKENDLTYIAHPALRNAYPKGNMKFLSNYDGIEVLNNYIASIEHWDEALSSGNYVTILSNDDAHDVSNPNEVGKKCTFINSPSLNRSDIMEALKSGNSIGVDIYSIHNESIYDKINRTKVLPVVKSFSVHNETVEIRIDSNAREIRFVGQEGKIIHSVVKTNQATYFIQPNDTYVRTEIEFRDGTVYYLNPVCRTTSSSSFNSIPSPKINWYKTSLLRILGIISILFIAINIYVLRRRIRRKS